MYSFAIILGQLEAEAKRLAESAWNQGVAVFFAVILLAALLWAGWYVITIILPSHKSEMKELRAECRQEREAYLASLERIENNICVRLDKVEGGLGRIENAIEHALERIVISPVKGQKT